MDALTNSVRSYIKSLTREDVKNIVFLYAPLVLGTYGLITHYGSGRKKSRGFLLSMYCALKSSNLRNVVILASTVSIVTARLFGLQLKKTFPFFFMSIWRMIYRARLIETPTVWFRRTFWNSHLVEKSKIT